MSPDPHKQTTVAVSYLLTEYVFVLYRYVFFTDKLAWLDVWLVLKNTPIQCMCLTRFCWVSV